MLYNTAEEGINVSHAYLRKKPKSKLQFPSWKAVLGDLLAHARAHNPNDFDAGLPDCKGIADELTLLRDVILSRNLELLFSHVPSYRSTYTSSCNLDEVLAQFKSQPIRPNEFYAVFDLRTAQYREMDNKLNDLLGFRPGDFDIPSLMQKDSFTHIFHPRDHYHMLRWACLAQCQLEFSAGIQWRINFVFDFVFELKKVLLRLTGHTNLSRSRNSVFFTMKNPWRVALPLCISTSGSFTIVLSSSMYDQVG